jgi:hypothetical protein
MVYDFKLPEEALFGVTAIGNAMGAVVACRVARKVCRKARTVRCTVERGGDRVDRKLGIMICSGDECSPRGTFRHPGGPVKLAKAEEVGVKGVDRDRQWVKVNITPCDLLGLGSLPGSGNRHWRSMG